MTNEPKTAAKVPDEYSEKARVDEIRKRILDRKAYPGGPHPEDVSWVAAEAYRLHIVRENTARALKEQRERADRMEAVVRSLIGSCESLGFDDPDTVETGGVNGSDAVESLDGLYAEAKKAVGPVA